MNSTPPVKKRAEFLGKHDKVLKGDISQEVQNCIDWLFANNFRTTRPSSDEHQYGPHIGCRFEVLRPLETCGNGDNLPILEAGIWECTHHQRSTSGVLCTFKSSDKGEVYLRVGYRPVGGHAIMAWKNNIRKI